MAIPRDVYFELGGYSRAFPHSYNDVDFAFKALEKNYRIIWTPLAKIWHFESLSRNPQVREDEFNLLHRRWGRYFGQDRFSSHLS
jgi:GT2 family glycosyltransferase